MDLTQALLEFFVNGKLSSMEGFVHSQNRSQAIARLSNWRKFCESSGLAEPSLSRLIASIGEITNNCFDHNLGHWTDLPGCCVCWSKEGDFIKFGVADRGRGIVKSLKPALSSSTDENDILPIAFEKVVSGRSPEQRGNGLKFVRAQILSSPLHSLVCSSGGSVYKIGNVPPPSLPLQDFGTITLINWSLK